jgi:hypothetical protein
VKDDRMSAGTGEEDWIREREKAGIYYVKKSPLGRCGFYR